MPNGSKTALYIYLAPQVLAKKNNSSVVQARKKMKEQTKMWIEKNNIDVTQSAANFWTVVSESTEDKKKYYDYF